MLSVEAPEGSMTKTHNDHFPALRARRRPGISPEIDATRRVLWRAYQHSELTDEEFARTLEQLEPPAQQPTAEYSDFEDRDR